MDERDKKAFILEIDNINDLELLKNMASDPVVGNMKPKLKTDMLLINTHMNIISEEHLIEKGSGKKKLQLFNNTNAQENEKDLKFSNGFLLAPPQSQ